MTAIVVAYNSRHLIEGSLESVRAAARHADLSVQLVVVDNASIDGSAAFVEARFPEATILENTANVGFGRANNQAAAVALGRHLLLLNPDAALAPSALTALVDALVSDASIGAVAPSVRSPGSRAESAGMRPGIRSFAAHFLFLNRLLPRTWRKGPWDGFLLPGTDSRDPAVDVDWASGAALMIRAEAFRDVGGFDPSIFLYGEDIELCARLQRRGWRIVLVPQARASHELAGTQQGISIRWVDGLHAVFSRERPRVQVLILDLLMGLGLGIRAFGGAVVGRGGSLHYRRMAASARRALSLASATVRGHPSLGAD